MELTASPRDYFKVLLERLPVAVVVIGNDTAIRYASSRAGELVGLAPDDLPGCSILDFLDPDDVGSWQLALDFARDYYVSIMGPVRARYRSVDGWRISEVWSNNCFADAAIGGLVCVIADESAAVSFGAAITSIANDDPLQVTLGLLIDGLSKHPVRAECAIVSRSGDVSPVHHPSLPAQLTEAAVLSCFWPPDATTDTLPAVLADLEDLDPDLRRAAGDHGLAAAWCYPIKLSDGTAIASLVIWRPIPGPPSPNQAAFITEALNAAQLAICRTIHHEQLEHAAFHDPLTGLGNRAAFFADGSRGEPGLRAVLYLDLDGFKAINDLYGHRFGDEVLAAAAQRLSSQVRPHDQVTRLGGDEFAVVCNGVAGRKEVALIAERLIRGMDSPLLIGQTSCAVGLSVGIAVGEHDSDLDHLLTLADSALYEAKAAGKGTWKTARDDS